MTLSLLTTAEIAKEKVNLPLLTIEAAEELQRLKKHKETGLEKTKELSALIKEKFNKRLDYSLIFRDAYSSTYLKHIPSLFNINSKKYIELISNKLEFSPDLESKELDGLIKFCVKLSDYASMYKERIEVFKGRCFG